MIPEFPEFKKLELSDKEKIEKITKKFPPYSDFNFVSMWSWNIADKMQISQLYGNLVVHFTDYLTGETFLSFIGENKISETTIELIAFSKKNYQVDSLKLVPEEIANILDKSKFAKLSDVNSHDYIYSVKELANMHNWLEQKSSKGVGIEKFLKLHPDYLVKTSSITEIIKDESKKMFKEWALNKKITTHSELNEYKAFKRFLEIKSGNIEVISLYKDNQLIGFTAYEIISKEYAIAHFSKANKKHHSAIYDILIWEEAKFLNQKGVKYYNWEQDLGIFGLRKAKEKYMPSFLLNKFIVNEKT